MLKILKIQAEGLQLFDGKCEISFINSQKTSEDDRDAIYEAYSDMRRSIISSQTNNI